MLDLIPGREDEGLRLDRFLSRETDLPRSRVQKAVQRGQCRVEGKECRDNATKLRSGQHIHFCPLREEASPLPEEGSLSLVYRDHALIVLDKPPYLTVHPCPSCPEGTLVNRLLSHFPEIARQEGARPGIVHRLDKDTSGLMVVALQEKTRLVLAESFAGREVSKTYLALCRGLPPSPGSSSVPLGRHPTVKTKMAVVPEQKGGKTAFSEWRNLYEDPMGRFALCAVTIHSGRTHQIRVHLAQAGYPLWGDKVYGPPKEKADPAPRQMLHAWKLAFPHPETGEYLHFLQEPPPDFLQTIVALSRATQKLIITGCPGCGKSALSAILHERGLPVWSADACVAALYQPGADGWLLLQRRFGEKFILEPGAEVDRAALGLALLEDPGLKPEIENMIHPLVYDAMQHFFAQAEADGQDLAVAEVPLWFENQKHEVPGSPPLVITVTCPASVRHQRLKKTRGWSEAKIAGIEAWQWSEDSKVRSSAYVLENTGTLLHLRHKSEELLQSLCLRRQDQEQQLVQHMQALWKL